MLTSVNTGSCFSYMEEQMKIVFNVIGSREEESTAHQFTIDLKNTSKTGIDLSRVGEFMKISIHFLDGFFPHLSGKYHSLCGKSVGSLQEISL